MDGKPIPKTDRQKKIKIKIKNNYRLPFDIWEFAIPTSRHNICSAPFPPELCKRCILASCPPNGLVLDMFNGSGTTGLVALGLGRRYIGIDINKEFLDKTIERFEKELGFLI